MRERASRPTLHQSSHGFATETNALAREIPPATQVVRLLKLESVGASLIGFGNPTRPRENEGTSTLKSVVD